MRRGIAANPGPGLITVSARRVGPNLELCVANTGSPVPLESLRKADGIGLENTRSRLAALYKDRQEFVAIPRESGGVRVRIRIPAETSPEALPT